MPTEDVAARFAEAVETGRRLPRVKVQGYFNVWPAFAREVWKYGTEDEHVYRPLPPTPQAIDRMHRDDALAGRGDPLLVRGS
jgi:Domain of unknown function (DUF6362)